MSVDWGWGKTVVEHFQPGTRFQTCSNPRYVVCRQGDSAEYQQADALWELFLELRTTVAEHEGPSEGGDDADDNENDDANVSDNNDNENDDDDEENSRMSSVTDDTASRDEGPRPQADLEVTGVGPKVSITLTN